MKIKDSATKFDVLETFQVKEHIVPSQHIREYPRATYTSQDNPLFIVVKQYIPRDNLNPSTGDISIVSAHANGIPKEAYEPLWVEIYQTAKRVGLKIRGIWIADVAHQGASGVLNEGKLGNDPSAFDHSRDLILMINQLRDELPRPIFGLGHSMGATQLINVSLIHPRIFQGLLLVEPIVFPYNGENRGRYPPAQISARRRDRFESLDSAISHFQSSKMFRTWDSRAFDMWIRYGLRYLPGRLNGEVTLATPKSQEIFTFIRPVSALGIKEDRRILFPDLSPEAHADALFYRPEPPIMYRNLPYLRPSILYVFGHRSGYIASQLQESIISQTGVGVGGRGGSRKGQVKQVTMQDAGHFVPMEQPRELAEKIVDWFRVEHKQWTVQENNILQAPNFSHRVSQEFLSQLEGASPPIRSKPSQL